jgi:hypothetical protein
VSGLRLLHALATALLHLLVATLGVAVSSAVCFYALKPILVQFVARDRLIHDALLSLPFFPFQSLVGFVTGFAFASRAEVGRKRVARWVWIAPASCLLILFIAWSPRSVFIESDWEHFFWTAQSDSKKEQLITTLPLLTSITYGLGSYLGCKYYQARREPRRGTHNH